MRITFDTNMFLHNLDDIEKYSIEDEIVVLLPVISELDNIKNNSKDMDLKYRGRKATKYIKEHIELDLMKSLEYPNDDYLYEVKPLNKFEIIDDLIISICKEEDLKLITRDYNVYLKCKNIGVECELVENENKIENLSMIYKGVQEIYTSSEVIDKVHKSGYVNIEELQCDTNFNENECITLISYSNPKHTALTKYSRGFIRRIKYEDNQSYWGLKPKNAEQKYALSLLADEDIRIVSMTGVAGSSKTILSFAVGLELKVNNFGKGKLYIARPPVSLSRKLQQGFKPGTTIEKAIGTLGSYSTNLERLSQIKGDGRKIDGSRLLMDMLEQCEISYLNLEDILGMSFSDEDYIIIDEAELLTKDEMKAILTRGGKIIVLGDVEQGGDSKVDYENSGLLHLIEVGKKSPLIAHITLQTIYRSEIVKEINEIW